MIVNIWDGIIQPSKRKGEEVKIHLSIVLPFLLMMWKTKNINVKWLTRNISISGLLSSMLIITGYKITCSWKLSIRLEKNLDETKNPSDLNNWLVHWHHDFHNWLVHWHDDIMTYCVTMASKWWCFMTVAEKKTCPNYCASPLLLRMSFPNYAEKDSNYTLWFCVFWLSDAIAFSSILEKKNSKTENAIDFISYEISKF